MPPRSHDKRSNFEKQQLKKHERTMDDALLDEINYRCGVEFFFDLWLVSCKNITPYIPMYMYVLFYVCMHASSTVAHVCITCTFVRMHAHMCVHTCA